MATQAVPHLQCPKCGTDNSAGDIECRRCGIVFARLHDAKLHLDGPLVLPLAATQPSSVTPTSAHIADPTESLMQAGRWVLVAALTWLTLRFGTSSLDAHWVNANSSFLHLPNLVFHEAGHVVFSPFGRFLAVLGGSLFQILVPLILACAFMWQQANWFGGAVMVWWAGQNLTDVAPYIADSRRLQLVLLGGHTGAEVEGHDWEYILTTMGWLHRDIALGRAAHAAGTVVMAGAVVWAIVLLVRPAVRPNVV